MKKRVIDGIEVLQGSGNVYADLGLPDPEKYKVRADLAIHIIKAMRHLSLTQQGAEELVSMEQLSGIPNLAQVRLALGVSMFRDKRLSITAAAKVAGKPLSEMLTLVSNIGIPVVDYSPDEVDAESVIVEKLVREHHAKMDQYEPSIIYTPPELIRD